jgi:hypothetical protein
MGLTLLIYYKLHIISDIYLNNIYFIHEGITFASNFNLGTLYTIQHNVSKFTNFHHLILRLGNPLTDFSIREGQSESLCTE